MDDELYELIGRAISGNKEAFADLLRRFQGSVYRYAYGMLGDRMEAEDAAQEAFIKAYYALPRLENRFAFASWLMRIVANQCRDRLQKRSRERPASDELLEHAGALALAAGEDSIERKQLQLSIEEAMRRLSPDHREVVLLRDVEGYSYEEIADMLLLPLGTVKSRINAARLGLRNEMKR